MQKYLAYYILFLKNLNRFWDILFEMYVLDTLTNDNINTRISQRQEVKKKKSYCKSFADWNLGLLLTLRSVKYRSSIFFWHISVNDSVYENSSVVKT